MKFTVNEDKFVQFGSEQIVFKKGQVYKLEDFPKNIRQSLSYIIRMNKQTFNVISDQKPKQVVSQPVVVEPKKEEVKDEKEEVKVEDVKEEYEIKEEEKQVEKTKEEQEYEEEKKDNISITEKELNDMTKQELIEFGEGKLGIDIIVNNKKQEIYDQILDYLLENDMIVSE